MRVVWLGEDACRDTSLVGGKAANLSRLATTFRVPEGYCVCVDGTDDLMLEHIRPAGVDSYRRLAERLDQDAPVVAVRSSAVDEDGTSTSFAGQHETVLGVKGEDRLVEALEHCFASFTAPRVLAYRRSNRLAERPGRVAMLVQRLVVADVAGVVFSVNPVTRVRSEVVVNASWGLGESIVSGTVTPDTYVVPKNGDAIKIHVGLKRRMTVLARSQAREVDVPPALRSLPCLSEPQARQAADLALALEGVMGRPVDVECAWKGDELFLLQCRPVTALRRRSRNA